VWRRAGFLASIITIMVSALASGSAAAGADDVAAGSGSRGCDNDESINATSGAAQRPDLLREYSKRSPCKVAGVDYGVGAPSTAVKDPATIQMAGVSVNTSSRTITITGNNVTLDGYDFSLHGGYQIAVSGSNTTITNSNFAIGTNPGSYLISGSASASNLTVTHNTFDGSAIGNELSFIRYSGAGAVNLEYNWFKNFPGHIVEFTQANGSPSFSVDYKYNLIEQGSLHPGYHLNFLQFGGGTASSVDVEFNTTYQTPQVSGGEGFQFYSNTQGGVIQNATMAYNTMIAKGGATGSAMSYMVHANSYNDNSSAQHGSVHDNFFDLQAAWGAFYSAPNGWSFANNVDMRTGKVINSNNQESEAIIRPTIKSVSAGANMLRNGGVTDAKRLVMTGTASPGSILKIRDGETQIGLVQADRTGVWKYASIPLSDGDHQFMAIAVADKTSEASSAFSVIVDTTAPAPPSIAVSNSIQTPTDTLLVMLSGTAEPGSTVSVFEGAVRVGASMADASGAWTISAEVSRKSGHVFTARAVDVAENTSAESSKLVLPAPIPTRHPKSRTTRGRP
jgi:Bacterial Ig domain/Bacterial Ig-like domain